jgi:hypothetical protein
LFAGFYPLEKMVAVHLGHLDIGDDQLDRFLDGPVPVRQGFELRHTALRLRVELSVLDRLRDLIRDRREEVDLVPGELAWLERPDVESARKPLAREDRHGQNRLVLLLREVREELEARIEVSLRRDHHGRTLGRSGAGDPLSGAHPRAPRHLRDARTVRRAQDELVGALDVEVDEAGLRAENVGDLARNEPEYLLQIERRVDGRDRLDQKPEVALARVHVELG